MLKVIVHIAAVFALTIGYTNTSNAQKQGGEKTFLQQLEEEEESEKRKSLHQGQEKPASESLQKARDHAKSDAKSCPSGSTTRKAEDVREYLKLQDQIQQRFAASLERFTTKKIDKNSAIDDFNKLIMESNDIVLWGRGKVTDGACGSTMQTEIIGKAIGATKNLIIEYKRALQ